MKYSTKNKPFVCTQTQSICYNYQTMQEQQLENNVVNTEVPEVDESETSIKAIVKTISDYLKKVINLLLKIKGE